PTAQRFACERCTASTALIQNLLPLAGRILDGLARRLGAEQRRGHGVVENLRHAGRIGQVRRRRIDLPQAARGDHARLILRCVAAGGEERIFRGLDDAREDGDDLRELHLVLGVGQEQREVRGQLRILAGAANGVEGAEDDREQGAADIRRRGVSARDVVVGIAASGRTPYVLGAMQAAKEAGATVVALVCNAGSPMEALADITICTVVGPEVLMGSTRMKAGTAQKLVLNMLSTGVMIRLGKVYSNLLIGMQATNQKLLRRAVRIVQLALDVDEETARSLLERADGRMDVAIVMHKA